MIYDIRCDAMRCDMILRPANSKLRAPTISSCPTHARVSHRANMVASKSTSTIRSPPVRGARVPDYRQRHGHGQLDNPARSSDTVGTFTIAPILADHFEKQLTGPPLPPIEKKSSHTRRPSPDRYYTVHALGCHSVMASTRKLWHVGERKIDIRPDDLIIIKSYVCYICARSRGKGMHSISKPTDARIQYLGFGFSRKNTGVTFCIIDTQLEAVAPLTEGALCG